MKTQLAVTEAELQQLLRDVAFTRHYDFSLQALADGECTLNVPFQEAFERPGGQAVHRIPAQERGPAGGGFGHPAQC